MTFDDFDIDLFLSEYWQKKPLLIRNPWKNWQNPITADHLAGLSCEDHIESRLIIQHEEDWELQHGPFDSSDFETLDKQIYTLLVQAVDHYIPEVSTLLNPFRFIPNWRIDDIMVSYANKSGGVGPHYDQYDVFLIQGLGKRRWQIGQLCDENTALITHDDLRLMADFKTQDEYDLEAGDILYIPPYIAHNGVALSDDCMTYSVGFRAPSRSDIITHYCDHILDNIQQNPRYQDKQIQLQENPGQINNEALNDLHKMFRDAIGNHNGFTAWFGQYSSTSKYPDIDWTPDELMNGDGLQMAMDTGAILRPNPASRFNYIEQDNQLTLFVDGVAYDCEDEVSELARHLCSTNTIDMTDISSTKQFELIVSLYNKGSILLIKAT